MKVELTALDRGFVSNALRRIAMDARTKAKKTKSDRQRVDYEDEARTAEELAIRFDEGEELVTDEPKPIVVNPRIDLDQLDDTGKHEARRPRVTRPETTRTPIPESQAAGAVATGEGGGG